MHEQMREFWLLHSDWSQSTFGVDSERGPVGPLKHLAKEVEEALANPSDLMEYVDCVFLSFDAARRAGFTFDDLMAALWEKLEINKARTWPRPTSSDEPVEHKR